MNGSRHIKHDFISRLTEIVEANLHNDQFGVDELVREMGMSRTSIHRHLKNITHQSISQFIRKVRLEKAMQMLLDTDEPSSEIAYQVGFGSPAYFTHCFHEHYGFSPVEARKRALSLTEPESGQDLLSVDKPEKRIARKRKAVYFALAGTIILALLFLSVYIVFYGFPQMQAGSAPSVKSIVVLPFKNYTDDSFYQYFADGIAEDVLNNLYHIKALRVVSRTSVEQFRERNLPVGDIARMMKVEYVLEGSIRSHENKIRITIQLIDAINDNHLWSANFDRELTNMLDIQDDVAFQVARNLDAVLSQNEIRKIEKSATQNPQAYDYYLRARFLLHKANSTHRADFEKTGVLNCIPYYEKAIAADSTFSEAIAGLANAWFNLSAWGILPAHEGFPKAKKLSLKALEIDPECAEAHAVLGAFLIWGGGNNIEDGGKEIKKAVELNPNFSTAHQWYAQYFMITGPIEEARFHVNRALELEPYFWVVQTLSAWIYYFEKKYKRAIEDCKVARTLKPDFIDNSWLFVLNYAKLGDGEKMLQELQSIIKKFTLDERYLEEVQMAFDENGINGIFIWLINVNNHKPIPVEGMDGHPFYSAWWNAILGNKSEAVYWLEQTMEDPRPLGHYSNLIITNPDFDILKDDPGFLKIIDQKGLTPYHNRETD